MSELADGPKNDAVNYPNAVQIGRLEVQINRLLAAIEEADGKQKRMYLEGQIEQLKEQQRILYCQMSYVPESEWFDRDTVISILDKQKSELPADPKGAPPNAFRIELDNLIAAIGRTGRSSR